MDISKYYELICRQPILTRKEEEALFTEMHAEGTSARRVERIRETVLSANLRFVFKKAKHYSKKDPTQFEELISAGNEGLIVGLNKYNHLSGYRFLSYAGWWIMQRQLKEMSLMRIVSLPIGRQQLSSRILKAHDQAGRRLTVDELVEKFPQSPRKDITELNDTRYLTYYFDDMMEENLSMDDFDDQLHEDLYKDNMQEQLAKLDYPKGDILSMSYGIVDGRDRNISYIAKFLNMTNKEVSALKKEAIADFQLLFNRT